MLENADFMKIEDVSLDSEHDIYRFFADLCIAAFQVDAIKLPATMSNWCKSPGLIIMVFGNPFQRLSMQPSVCSVHEKRN
jgi:hypothetical protein